MSDDPFKVSRGRGRFQDLTGSQFGWLRVECRLPSPDKKSRWMCTCRCGQTGIVAKVDLLKCGKKNDCGCRESQRVCAVGRRFGALIVAEPLQRGDQGYQCLCTCICGTSVTVPMKDLMSRRTLHCGCGSTVKVNRPQRARAIELYLTGMSAAQVGKAIGRSKYVVIEWIRTSGHSPRPHPSQKWNKEQKQRAMRLYASGYSLGDASKMLGCCSSALARWLKLAGQKMRTRADYPLKKAEDARPPHFDRGDASALGV